MANITAEQVVRNTLLDLGIEGDKIIEKSFIKADLNLDSVEIVEIIVSLQKFFDFDISIFKDRDDLTLGEIYQLAK